MQLITGNTYPVKDQLKALGGKWNAPAQGWDVPDNKAEEARQIVAAAPASAPRRARHGGSRYTRFNSGAEVYTNRRGRCEDVVEKTGARGIRTRFSTEGESLTLLGGQKPITLPAGVLMLTDAVAGTPLDIAGTKGGTVAELYEGTKNILISSAAYDPILIRKTSQKLKIRTDASHRFENNPSEVIAEYGAHELVVLLLQVAGGTLSGYKKIARARTDIQPISVSLQSMCAVLGATVSVSQVQDVLTRLGYTYTVSNEVFTVTPTFTATEVKIPEDVIEEVGRIIGYDAVEPTPLPQVAVSQNTSQLFSLSSLIREKLIERGCSEILTSVFSVSGERAVSNKVASDTPYLRADLIEGMQNALQKNILVKDIVALPRVMLFEIGAVWSGGVEKQMLCVGVEKVKKQSSAKDMLGTMLSELGITSPVMGTDTIAFCELSARKDSSTEVAGAATPSQRDTPYVHFSKYPSISRDIALWCEKGVTAEQVLELLRVHAGTLLVQSFLFDTFEKEGKVSFAFRLVFQSFDRTLVDDDAVSHMNSVYQAVQNKGWVVR